MKNAAAARLGGTASGYTVHDGVITGPDGKSLTFAQLT